MKLPQVTRYTVQVPSSFSSPVRIVYLSDLHNAQYDHSLPGDWIQRRKRNDEIFARNRRDALELRAALSRSGNISLYHQIHALHPDLILAGGDLVTGTHPEKCYIAAGLLKALAYHYPIYYSSGNHEQRLRQFPETAETYRAFRKEMQALGIHFLENTSQELAIGGSRLRLYGLEYPRRVYYRFSRADFSAAELQKRLGNPDPELFTILLAHTPAYFPSYQKWGADLTLSGHYHGGLLRLPFLGGVISPQLRLFPPYDRGLYQKEKSVIITGAGLGDHMLIPRIHNPREILLITLQPERSS